MGFRNSIITKTGQGIFNLLCSGNVKNILVVSNVIFFLILKLKNNLRKN